MALQTSFAAPFGPVIQAPEIHAYQPSPSSITLHTIRDTQRKNKDQVPIEVLIEPWIRELEKRDAAQQPAYRAVESAVQPISGAAVSGHDLCAAGTQAVWRGATATQQQVMILTKGGSTVTPQPTQSASIQASLGALRGENLIKMSCDSTGQFDTITTEGRIAPSSTYFDRIINFTLAVPQRLAAMSTSVFTRAWSVATLPGKAIFAPIFGSNYTVKITNTSGLFDPTTPGTTIATAAQPMLQGVASHESGGFSLFETRDAPGLFQVDLDASGQVVQTTDIASGQTIGPVEASQTPIPQGASYTAVMTAGPTATSPALYAEQLGIPPRITFNLTLGAEPNILEVPRGTHCGTADPHRFCYARESYTASSATFAMKYDCVDTTTGTSIIGGEKTASTYPPTTTRPIPKLGCFDDGTMIVSFLNETRMPNFFTITLQNTTGGAPAIIQVSIPPGLSQTFIPITSAIVSFSNNTLTLQFTQFNGFQVIYTVNGSLVPLCSTFDANAIYNMSISAGTAIPGSAPQLCGNTSVVNTDCTPSYATSFLQDTVTTAGVMLEYILGGVLGAVALVTGGGVVVYCTVIKPHRRKIRQKQDKSPEVQDVMERSAAQRMQFKQSMRGLGEAPVINPSGHGYGRDKEKADVVVEMERVDV